MFPKTTLEEAEQLLQKAIKIIPNLTDNGVGLPAQTRRSLGYDQVLIQQEINKEQDYLHRKLREIAAAADYCKQRTPRKTINYNSGSYGYKHQVERWHPDVNYVSNGAFIAAAVGLGFKFKGDNGPNLAFNFGKRTGDLALAWEKERESWGIGKRKGRRIL